MELVLLTIIFCIIGMILCMGLGYIAGTISVEDAKKDVAGSYPKDHQDHRTESIKGGADVP